MNFSEKCSLQILIKLQDSSECDWTSKFLNVEDVTLIEEILEKEEEPHMWNNLI